MRNAICAVLLLPLMGCGVELLTTTAVQGELQAQSAKQGMAALESAKATKAIIETQQAVRLYQAEHGQYPASLDVLVPEYLPSKPNLGYNPSTGEVSASGGMTQARSNSTAGAYDDNAKMKEIREAVNAYGRKTGYYPGTLSDLVPEYLDEVPTASNGEPFLYNSQFGTIVNPKQVERNNQQSAPQMREPSYTSPSTGITTHRNVTGSGPNPKATMDRTRSNLNKALQGRQ